MLLRALDPACQAGLARMGPLEQVGEMRLDTRPIPSVSAPITDLGVISAPRETLARLAVVRGEHLIHRCVTTMCELARAYPGGSKSRSSLYGKTRTVLPVASATTWMLRVSLRLTPTYACSPAAPRTVTPAPTKRANRRAPAVS